MADFMIRTVHVERTEYTLPSPTNWGEVRKAIASIEAALGDELASWDDTVTVEARGDELVFWYETKRTRPEGQTP